jgi:hypothetical protein
MKKLKFFLTVCLLSANVFAQYPTIPADVQRSSDSLMRAAIKHSDAAWALALPIIREEAKKGKPYVDFASRPTDLPQASSHLQKLSSGYENYYNRQYYRSFPTTRSIPFAVSEHSPYL